MRINISETTKAQLEQYAYKFEDHGTIEVKVSSKVIIEVLSKSSEYTGHCNVHNRRGSLWHDATNETQRRWFNSLCNETLDKKLLQCPLREWIQNITVSLLPSEGGYWWVICDVICTFFSQ